MQQPTNVGENIYALIQTCRQLISQAQWKQTRKVSIVTRTTQVLLIVVLSYLLLVVDGEYCNITRLYVTNIWRIIGAEFW